MVNSYDDMMGEPSDPEDHPANNMPQATQHYAGDVVPILKNFKEEYSGQAGVRNSTGELSQHLNNSTYRTISDRTNIVPLRINK